MEHGASETGGQTGGTAGRYPVSVAPMMDRTDRHFRFFMRQITKRALLYTEMTTTAAVLRGDRERLLGYSEIEHPIALQLGGDRPDDLAEAARIGEDFGYDEINLNCGCPSERVQQGSFGACLMAQPQRVAECVAAMRAIVRVPVTVKHRIGIDGLEQYEDLARFVAIVAQGGCARFIVHARIAKLGGGSPKRNRSVPPLRYEDVYRLKRDFPALTVELNGGIASIDEVIAHLAKVDGAMIGRAAYETPFLFAEADRRLCGDEGEPPMRRAVAEAMIPYLETWQNRQTSRHALVRHLHGLFAGQPGSTAWKRHLGTGPGAPRDLPQLIREALSLVPSAMEDAAPSRSSARNPAPQR